ncbi:MAG: PA2778 family cysteine peptidase, partial [Chromatiaceae bacterium]|nr:PA2778 family cysteine peptidase [Candidatus Thioaporhodococcus sediminis]
MTRLRPLLLGVAFVFVLVGCATSQTRAFLQDLATVPKPWVTELEQVAFFPQEDHQCGPAALATALHAAGVEINPAQLLEQVYIPGREGSLQVEMLAATRRNGALPYLLKPELRDLLAEVRAGMPVVVLQILGLSWIPVVLYAVIVGYVLPHRHVVLRSC